MVSYNPISNGPAPTYTPGSQHIINTGPISQPFIQQPTEDKFSDFFGLAGKALDAWTQSRERIAIRKKIWAEEDKKINILATQYKDLGIGNDQAYSLAKSSIPLTSRTLAEAKAKRQFTDLHVKTSDKIKQNPQFAKITDGARILHDGFKKGTITDINGLDIKDFDVLSAEGLKKAWSHILPSDKDLEQLGPLKRSAIDYVLKRGNEVINLQGERQNKENQQILNNNASIAANAAFSMAITGDLDRGTVINLQEALDDADPSAVDSITDDFIFQINEITTNEHPSTINWNALAVLPVSADGKTFKEHVGVKKFNQLQDDSRYIEKLAEDKSEEVALKIDELGLTNPLEKQKMQQQMIMDSEEYQSLPSSSAKAEFLEYVTKERDEDAITNLKLQNLTGEISDQKYLSSLEEMHSSGYITDEQYHEAIYGKIKEIQSRRDAANNAKIMADTLAKAIMADKKSALKDLVDTYTSTITSLGREGKPIRIRDAVPILQSFYGAAEIRPDTMTPADYEAGRIMLNTGLRFVTTELEEHKNNYNQNLTDAWKTKRPRLSRNDNFNQRQFETFVEKYNERYNSDLNSLTEEQKLWQEELDKPFWKKTPTQTN